MFSQPSHASYATPKTYTKESTKPKYTKPELPQGVAAKYYYTKDETVCLLVKSEKPENHRVPKFAMQLVVFAAGVAHTHPLDQNQEKSDKAKGEVIALGRAIKMYNESRSLSVLEHKMQFYLPLPLAA